MDLPGQQLQAANAHTPLDHLVNLDINKPPGCQRLTGIIATMGKNAKTLFEIFDSKELSKVDHNGINGKSDNALYDI